MMNHYQKRISRTLFIAGSFLLPLVSLAQIENPLGNLVDIPGFVNSLLGYVVRIGGIISIFAFMYTGYLFVKARGNESELGKAKTAFYNTCIGVAILLGAQLIASIIVGTIKNLKS